MGSSSFQPAATEKGGGPGACPFPSPSAASAPGNRGLPLPLSSRRAPGLPTRACERRQSRPAEPRPRSPRARPDPPAEAGEGYQQLGQDGGQLPAAQRLRPAPHLPEGHGARRRRALLRHAAAAPEPRQLPAGPEARRRDRKLAAEPAGLASSPLAAPTNHREEAACLAREGLDSVVRALRAEAPRVAGFWAPKAGSRRAASVPRPGWPCTGRGGSGSARPLRGRPSRARAGPAGKGAGRAPWTGPTRPAACRLATRPALVGGAAPNCGFAAPGCPGRRCPRTLTRGCPGEECERGGDLPSHLETSLSICNCSANRTN